MKQSKSKATMKSKIPPIEEPVVAPLKIKIDSEYDTRFRMFFLTAVIIAVTIGWCLASGKCHCIEKKVIYDFKLVGKEYEPMYRYEKIECETCKRKDK